MVGDYNLSEEEKCRHQVVDKLIQILNLYKKKDGYIRYELLYKILIGFKEKCTSKE